MAENKRSKSGGSFFWRFLRSAALIVFTVLIFFYLVQRRMQYFPDRSPVPLPPGKRYPGLEEVELVAADGVRLLAWYWPGTRSQTLVLFHGNAGHRGHRLEWMKDFHDRGLGVFLLDYRGYGGSQGSPTEEGLYSDGQAAIEWLEKRGAGDLVYLGESLGCGVAVEMAVHRPPAALILQSGFSSAVDIARKHYGYLPVNLLMKDRYECREKIGKVGCPLLMIHGERDSIIPPSIGKALFDAAPNPKEWLLIPDADHNDPMWLMLEDYFERIDTFLKG